MATDASTSPTTMGTYAVLATVFSAAVGGSLVAASRRGELPERFSVGDIALLGIAAHKLSRILSKDKVTSFVRAPFVENAEEGAPGEVNAEPAGEGPRRAVGELLTCPFCVGTWVAGAGTVGLVRAPRVTRAVASVFAALAVSDFLHFARTRATPAT